MARADPVLLLHGLGGCPFDWSDVAIAGHSMLVPTAPWHGGRPAAGDLSFEAAATELLSWLDAVGIERVVVAGISMGAATGLTLASLAPDRVRGVLAVAPAWVATPDPPNLRRLRKVGRLMLSQGLDRAWEVVSSLPPVADWDARDRSCHRRAFLGFDPAAVGAAMDRLPQRLPVLAPALRGLPVEVCTWHDDVIHPIQVAGELAHVVGAGQPRRLRRPADRGDEQRLLARMVADFVATLPAATT